MPQTLETPSVSLPTGTTSPPESTPDDIRRTMRLSVAEGAATQIFINWTSGSVLIGYMLHLGATPTHLGLVASVPLLAQTMSPLAAWLAALMGKRRGLTVVASIIGRGLWLLAALLPGLGLPATLQPTFLVALVLVSSLFQSGAGTLWSAWMGDVVPDARRGSYFGMRAGVVGVVGMVANLASGWFLDRVAAPLSFEVVLAVAVLSAAVGIFIYTKQYDPPSLRERVSLGEVLRLPLRDGNFRHFLRFAVYWQFAVMLASPFVFPFFLEQLRLSFTHIALWGAIAALSALVTTILWGKVADRAGNKAVLAIGTFVAGLALPLCWILADLTGHLSYIWASAVFDAIAWGAIGPAIFNLALVSAPRERRAAFIGMYALVSGISGFLGGVLSGPLLELFRLVEIDLGEVHWSAYHWLFVLSGLARMQAWWFLRPVRETNAWRTRDVLRELRQGWRVIGFFWR